MEKLKSIIPLQIKRKIEQSNTEDLPSTCSSLHDFFAQSPLFHSVVNDLTNSELGFCAKNKEAAFELKLKGNACFSSSDYSQAARFYSQAIRVAPVEAVDKDKKLIATLYVNRASSFHAWYRRGRVNSSLLNCKDAIYDLEVALNIEGTASGKRQIEDDLKLLVNQKNGDSLREHSGKKQLVIDELPQAKLQCVSTPTKGRGMCSLFEIPTASLVHKEEPYAAIILKNFRDTYCHFCFNELPADNVPCTSCSIPLYCSERCQHQAGGQVSRKFLTNDETDNTLSDELQKYFSKVTSENHLDTEIECFSEHGHECHGVNWPVVLPTQVVLAGRILVKSMKQKVDSEYLDLSHNYVHLLPDRKVEFHVYSIVLLYCIYASYRSELDLCGATFAKVIVLISQIKVNSMAIVRMNYADIQNPIYQSENLSIPGDNTTSNLEQMSIGQAIYLSGSLFNHSCIPNIHAYFISRTLLIRATEFVPTGCALEMSYGPQIGQWDYGNRQQFLRDNYSFKCKCNGCTKVNLPDLVLNALHCAKLNCSGVVLDDFSVEYKKNVLCHLQETPEVHSMEHQREIEKLMYDEIKNIASLAFGDSNYCPEVPFGCCLKCGSANDLKSLHANIDEADTCVRSLQEAVVSNEVYSGLLTNALQSLNDLKSTLHTYSKKLAEAEDIFARAFCSIGEMQQAIEHCTVSIEILKKHYGPRHIAIGNELVKLSSLQLALGDSADLADTVNQMDNIFSNYYGKHAELMFPFLKYLKREVLMLADGGRTY
ncbi:Histone-lysine N-methyltransferase SMYD3 [Bienertia sinuspersici]